MIKSCTYPFSLNLFISEKSFCNIGIDHDGSKSTDLGKNINIFVGMERLNNSSVLVQRDTNTEKGRVEKLENDMSSLKTCDISNQYHNNYFSKKKYSCLNENVSVTSCKNKNSSEIIQKKKPIKRLLSMKRSYEAQDICDSDKEFSSRITSSQFTSETTDSTSTKTTRYQLLYGELDTDASKSLIQSNQQNLAILSHPEEHVKLEIKYILDRISNKEKYLDSLKQSNIYEKLHKVDEIKQLTLLWKNGCIKALSDLLEQLQSHGTIDMNILLRNLNIPSSIISYTSDGDLC